MYIRLGTLCVTVSLWLLAQGMFPFPILCMCFELSAHTILLSYLLSLCWVRVFHVVLSLMLSHGKSSLRSSVAQMADGNKQGAEPPHHPYHLVGLTSFAHCSGLPHWQNYLANQEIPCLQIIWSLQRPNFRPHYKPVGSMAHLHPLFLGRSYHEWPEPPCKLIPSYFCLFLSS